MNRVIRKDFSDKKTLEKYSSAFTLSDMEIFIFPDLFYPLVLANIMSPVIWKWREDPWFHNISKKSFTYRANRIKQFIIQNYVFNLDLSTWGLTTKTRETERFSDYIDIDTLRHSNALFGYEGDKYYFDIDIRKHFGLDKFNSDIIPYWKTETVEAMTAFRFMENFSTGAGECVSLSSLYAAAMFVVGRVPLDKIFLIATPLHSQNFINEKEGLITNNRRIVTKNMWFNGTSLSEKARRALENEKVTIVSHISGYIHTMYNKATIEKEAYEVFTGKLREFLETDLNNHVFINFLRFKSKYKTLFQYKCDCSGIPRYIMLDKMFEYEHDSKFSVAAETRSQLVGEIDGDEFHLSPVQGKLLMNEFEEALEAMSGLSLEDIETEFDRLAGEDYTELVRDMFSEIREFIRTVPHLPDSSKDYTREIAPHITTESTREEIFSEVMNKAEDSELCMLSLYAFRQMDHIDWLPFIKAALERNPVSLNDLKEIDLASAYERIKGLPNESIYEGKRLALPDEVWNFRRGDGVELAFLFANYILKNNSSAHISIDVHHKEVKVLYDGSEYFFPSEKGLKKKIGITGTSYISA